MSFSRTLGKGGLWGSLGPLIGLPFQDLYSIWLPWQEADVASSWSRAFNHSKSCFLCARGVPGSVMNVAVVSTTHLVPAGMKFAVLLGKWHLTK